MNPIDSISRLWTKTRTSPSKKKKEKPPSPVLISDTFVPGLATPTAQAESKPAPKSPEVQPKPKSTAVPTVLTILDQPRSDKDSVLGDLTGSDRKLVGSRLDKLPPSCLKVLANQEISVDVYSLAKTFTSGANGSFETAYARKSGKIGERTVRVARQALPGGASQELKRLPSLTWSGAWATAAVTVAAVGGPPGWVLGAAMGGMALAPAAHSAINSGRMTLEHEVTHALDSAVGLNGSRTLPMGEDGQPKPYYFSQNSPEVQSCFEAAKKEKRFLTSGSKENVKEYFADAGGAYLNEDPNGRLNRQKLKETDPAMFKVMDRFFKTRVPELAARLS